MLKMTLSLVFVTLTLFVGRFVAAVTLEERVERLERLETTLNTVLARLNDTSDLEVRVSVLEDSVAEVEEDVVILQNGFVSLTDEVDDVETSNTLQDQRLNIIETDVSDNEDNINGLDDEVTTLQFQLQDVELDVAVLDIRVDNLESGGGGGGGNITGLTERVDILEEVTSQLRSDISGLEATSADQETRIQELESVLIEPWEACLSSPCQNGGTCVDVNVGTFICMCRDGYFGKTCPDSFIGATFLVALGENRSGSFPNPIVYDREIINPGGHYHPETGIYTAPSDGIYQFSIHHTSSGETTVELFVDGSQTNSHDDYYSHPGYRMTTILLPLSAGQEVHVSTVDYLEGDPEILRSYFSGHLVNAI